MTLRWTLDRDQHKYGPFSMEELRQLIATGHLLANDMLLEEGREKWEPASSIPGLFTTTAVTNSAARSPLVAREAASKWPKPPEEADDESSYPDISAAPALWNPNVAANWSLLLTPIFGSYLHAANWRVLGEPRKAAANMAWLWATAVFLVINAAVAFLHDSDGVGRLMNMAAIGLLFGWYFTQGKSQAEYVKNAFPDGYVKKSWGAPLGIGIAAVAAYVATVFVIAVTVYSPNPNDLATAMKPLILEEWRKKPELVGAVINNISLVHKEGKVYTGFVDATLGGQPERLRLQVIYEGGNIIWELKPLN